MEEAPSVLASATEKRSLSIQDSIKEEAKETLACLQYSDVTKRHV